MSAWGRGKQGLLVWSHLAGCASPMSPLTTWACHHQLQKRRHRAWGCVSAEGGGKVKAKYVDE